MDHFYLITNQTKDHDFVVTGQIKAYLEGHGKSCSVRGEGTHSANYRFTNPDKIPPDTECILVLGGDGTLLQAARDVVNLQIPLLGINLGTLGYLAEIDMKSLYLALDHLISDEYEIERRMMLTGCVYRDGVRIAGDIALNDIVITREGGLRVVRFNNFVNGEFLNSYHADGIIVSTPTGSTGYSLSAGGPIISPSASLMVMTPLAPHTLNTRSIVFPSEDVIEVEVGMGRDGNTEHGMAYFDGDTSVPMVTGDRIVIKKAKKDTLIVKISNISFLETLRKKMANI
ncbi:MAG: NAD(+)/NADH kinase [Fusicatenibacter sp.]|nr:NAD(+)/NADH kinase [Fusicatenibacter sp.]